MPHWIAVGGLSLISGGGRLENLGSLNLRQVIKYFELNLAG